MYYPRVSYIHSLLDIPGKPSPPGTGTHSRVNQVRKRYLNAMLGILKKILDDRIKIRKGYTSFGLYLGGQSRYRL